MSCKVKLHTARIYWILALTLPKLKPLWTSSIFCAFTVLSSYFTITFQNSSLVNCSTYNICFAKLPLHSGKPPDQFQESKFHYSSWKVPDKWGKILLNSVKKPLHAGKTIVTSIKVTSKLHESSLEVSDKFLKVKCKFDKSR